MGNVAFRRINGHIVPIKMSTKEKVVTGAAASGGIGVAVSAGLRAGSLDLKTQKAAKAAIKFKTSSLFLTKHVGESAGHAASIKAAAQASKASKFAIRAGHTRQIGQLGSTALLGYAANRVLDKTSLKDDPTTRDAISLAVGAGATGIIHSAVNTKKFGIKSGFKTATKYVRKGLVIGLKVAKKRI